MIRTFIIARPLFVLAAPLATAPLAAQEPTVVTGTHQPVFQERVSFADLDLRQRSAQQLLKTRVTRASARVCDQAVGPFPEYGFASSGDASLTCADKTYSHAQPQIRAAIDRAKSGQPQLATALVISGPARTR